MPSNRIDTTPVEALVVVLICFGYFIVLSSEMAARDLPIRFGDAELVSGMFFEIFAAAIALTFLHARGYAIATLHARAYDCRSWRRHCLAGPGLRRGRASRDPLRCERRE